VSPKKQNKQTRIAIPIPFSQSRNSGLGNF